MLLPANSLFFPFRILRKNGSLILLLSITEKPLGNQAFIRGMPQVKIDVFPFSILNQTI